MSNIQLKQYSFFRSYEKKGFQFCKNSFNAEISESMPSLDSLEQDEDWFSGENIETAFEDIYGNAKETPRTKMRILSSEDSLLIGFKMEESQLAQMRGLIDKDSKSVGLEIPGTPLKYPAQRDDNIEVQINAAHDNRIYYSFLVTHRGFAHVSIKNNIYSESINPVSVPVEDLSVEWDHHVFYSKNKDAWFAFLKIPWKSIGLEGIPDPAIVGFNAVRVRSIKELTYFSLCPMVDHTDAVALDFGDLYLKPNLLEVHQIDFGLPVRDENNVSISLRAKESFLKINASIIVTRLRTGEEISNRQVECKVSDDKTLSFALPYLLDWQEPDIHEVAIKFFNSANNECLYSTCFELGRFASIPTIDKLDWFEEQANPAIDSKDFMTEKRNYILSKIPKLLRKTTRDGAPSDFCLMTEDKSICFNLMDEDICRQLAQWVENNFDNDIDRMCGASLFIHQKVFAMHCGPLTKMHNNFSPESAMRLNGGHCYSRALSLAGVMKEIHYVDPVRKNQKFDATIVFVLGHVIVRILEDDSSYLFDPTFGSFYFSFNNKRLATEEELGKDLTLADRYMIDRYKDFCSPESHAPSPVGNVNWP